MTLLTKLDEVRLQGSFLYDGESFRSVCPFCEGGSQKETSLSLTRDGNLILFNCFRASCGENGALHINSNDLDKIIKKTSIPGKVLQDNKAYRGELQPLSEAQGKVLYKECGFTSYHISVAHAMYAPIEHRYAFPIFDPRKRRRGWVLRSYTGAIPKVKTFKDNPTELNTSWYRNDPNKVLGIVVEDIPSAVRASKYIPNAIAMNGGGIGLDAVHELRNFVSDVLWAFDPDAFDKAMKTHNKFKLLFKRSRVVSLDYDIKNMAEVYLKRLLERFTLR